MAETNSAPYGRKTQKEPAVKEVHILWITAGLSCDGDSVSTTAASQPSIEDIVMGAIPGLPKVHLHNPVLAYEVGDEFMNYWYLADEDRLGAPFVLVVEGSIPNEAIKAEGYWAALGTDKRTGQPITTCEWIDRLAPMIPLDKELRPTWLFGKTVHEGCDRAGYYEQGDFANEYGSPKCLVKLGCWGPVVNCNVTKRGWMAGIGGCPNVGGICIGCTMPGFPDKFMPFVDEPPGGTVSSFLVGMYGRTIRALRGLTNRSVNKETKWRHRGRELATGYHPTTYGRS